jgi:hypothetical protein
VLKTKVSTRGRFFRSRTSGAGSGSDHGAIRRFSFQDQQFPGAAIGAVFVKSTRFWEAP